MLPNEFNTALKYLRDEPNESWSSINDLAFWLKIQHGIHNPEAVARGLRDSFAIELTETRLKVNVDVVNRLLAGPDVDTRLAGYKWLYRVAWETENAHPPCKGEWSDISDYQLDQDPRNDISNEDWFNILGELLSKNIIEARADDRWNVNVHKLGEEIMDLEPAHSKKIEPNLLKVVIGRWWDDVTWCDSDECPDGTIILTGKEGMRATSAPIGGYCGQFYYWEDPKWIAGSTTGLKLREPTIVDLLETGVVKRQNSLLHITDETARMVPGFMWLIHRLLMEQEPMVFCEMRRDQAETALHIKMAKAHAEHMTARAPHYDDEPLGPSCIDEIKHHREWFNEAFKASLDNYLEMQTAPWTLTDPRPEAVVHVRALCALAEVRHDVDFRRTVKQILYREQHEVDGHLETTIIFNSGESTRSPEYWQERWTSICHKNPVDDFKTLSAYREQRARLEKVRLIIQRSILNRALKSHEPQEPDEDLSGEVALEKFRQWQKGLL